MSFCVFPSTLIGSSKCWTLSMTFNSSLNWCWRLPVVEAYKYTQSKVAVVYQGTAQYKFARHKIKTSSLMTAQAYSYVLWIMDQAVLDSPIVKEAILDFWQTKHMQIAWKTFSFTNIMLDVTLNLECHHLLPKLIPMSCFQGDRHQWQTCIWQRMT